MQRTWKFSDKGKTSERIPKVVYLGYLHFQGYTGKKTDASEYDVQKKKKAVLLWLSARSASAVCCLGFTVPEHFQKLDCNIPSFKNQELTF